MTQVKMKFDTNTSTSKIIRTFRHFEKLFTRELIWIQCFHCPNITTCGKYRCVCLMLERYFVFTCCSANASISSSTRKRKNFDPCACVCAFLMPASRPFSRGNKKYYVCACTCACVASENQAYDVRGFHVHCHPRMSTDDCCFTHEFFPRLYCAI